MKNDNIVYNQSGRNINYDIITSSSGMLPISSTNNSTIIDATFSSFVIYSEQLYKQTPEENNERKEMWKSLVTKTSRLWDNVSVKDELRLQKE